MLPAIGLIYWSCIRQIEQRGESDFTSVTFILVFWHAFTPAVRDRTRRCRPWASCANLDRGLDLRAAVVAVAAACRPGGAARRRHSDETWVAVWIFGGGRRARAIGWVSPRFTPTRHSPDVTSSLAIRIHIFRKARRARLLLEIPTSLRAQAKQSIGAGNAVSDCFVACAPRNHGGDVWITPPRRSVDIRRRPRA